MRMSILKRCFKLIIKLITFGNAKLYNKVSNYIFIGVLKLKKIKYFFKCKFGQKIICDIRGLFLYNASLNKYSRLDTIVRYLAIENYYNVNDYGFALYKKMQEKRLGSKDKADI